MPTIMELMKADSIEVSYANLVKEFKIKHRKAKPIRALRDIEINPNNMKVISVAEVKTNGKVQYSHSSNTCRCGCLLRNHNFDYKTETLPCKKHRSCKDYGR